MGTNETFGRRFNTDEFSGQMEAFLALVKKELPNTAILLTTPPECYRRVRSGKQRTYVRNDNTERAARAIRNVAKKEEVACWDLFTTTGGKNSCRKWHSSRLMGRIGFTLRKKGIKNKERFCLGRSWNHIITDKNFIWNIIYLEIGLVIINSRGRNWEIS